MPLHFCAPLSRSPSSPLRSRKLLDSPGPPLAKTKPESPTQAGEEGDEHAPELRHYLCLKENLHDLFLNPHTYAAVLKRVAREVETELPGVHEALKDASCKLETFLAKLLVFAVRRPMDSFHEVDKLSRANIDARISLGDFERLCAVLCDALSDLRESPKACAKLAYNVGDEQEDGMGAGNDDAEHADVDKILLSFRAPLINKGRSVATESPVAGQQHPWFSVNELSCLHSVLAQYALHHSLATTRLPSEISRRQSLMSNSSLSFFPRPVHLCCCCCQW
ncbi:unnamed protein product [Vitrella brassicaformis CCMP3155]|uniref:Uncharacterized protein n=1 Tax=Vitrella brassicaformis (strain CCMP3155) TaxID=1169540 RepID=A0A0G4GVV9_VITBC|nr:unnamed protein product [Vitrella brassicaformis CCMP3155]|eukprot:CEM35093.1 unnamed protein product [Vitrella brassicaformis CCMP3155]